MQRKTKTKTKEFHLLQTHHKPNNYCPVQVSTYNLKSKNKLKKEKENGVTENYHPHKIIIRFDGKIIAFMYQLKRTEAPK